jgi:MFS transporter, PAT family, beta-lactamase induction signal transducer AmpG
MPRLANLDTRGGRLAVFSLLYLSEGIPVGFSTVALAALLRLGGAGLDQVGTIVAATYLPWGLKWAWAPLVDLIRIPRLGPSRAWILMAQLMMIATLALMLGLDVAERVGLLATLVIIHNVFAATQDVAIDALCGARAARQ